MDLTDNGRFVVGSLALIAFGFGLGSLTGPLMPTEGSLALVGGAATLLLLASRRSRRDQNYEDEHRRDERDR